MLEKIEIIFRNLINNSRGKKISIKIKTLVKYAYFSIIKKTTQISYLKNAIKEVRVPSKFANQYFYTDVFYYLRQKYNIKIDRRKRNLRYIILEK